MQTFGKPQIYGTQFRVEEGKPGTEEPFQRDLISDALRRQIGMPSIADQEKLWMRVVAQPAKPN